MRRPLAVLLLVPVVGLSACNDAPTARARGRTVTISERDYRFFPQNVVVRHGRVTFHVRNDSRAPHNFQLRRGDREKGRVPTLKPGASGSLTLRLRRGTYTMSCGLAHHEVLGEYGTVTVR